MNRLTANRTVWVGVLLSATALLYGGVFLALDQFRFPLHNDERHFWPTILLFSESVVPSLELLRSYPELNTPLPFVLFGLLEYHVGGGVEAVRLANFALSFAVLALVVLDFRADSRTLPFIPLVGLLACPYFLGMGVHAYTDMMAALLVLLGVRFHLDNRFIVSALAFVLAISTRQFMVAFPVAITLFEFLRFVRRRHRDPLAWLAPLLASASLGGWIAFFGGIAPRGEVARQNLEAGAASLLPQNALYFLTAVGLYFVIVERLLVGAAPPFSSYVRRESGVIIGLILLGLFLAFPPLVNPNLPLNMGVFDRALQLLLPDALRLMVFCGLAWLAVMRFERACFPLLLLLVNAAMFVGAPIIWEKYALALIVVLWYLLARGALEDPAGRGDRGVSHGVPGTQAVRSGASHG